MCFFFFCQNKIPKRKVKSNTLLEIELSLSDASEVVSLKNMYRESYRMQKKRSELGTTRDRDDIIHGPDAE